MNRLIQVEKGASFFIEKAVNLEEEKQPIKKSQ
jgi:hypothetical protein